MICVYGMVCVCMVRVCGMVGAWYVCMVCVYGMCVWYGVVCVWCVYGLCVCVYGVCMVWVCRCDAEYSCQDPMRVVCQLCDFVCVGLRSRKRKFLKDRNIAKGCCFVVLYEVV